MKNKRIQIKLLGLILAASCLTGCGSNHNNEETVQEQIPVESAEEQEEATPDVELPVEETDDLQETDATEDAAQTQELEKHPYGPYRDTLVGIYKNIVQGYKNIEADYEGETGIAEHVMGNRGIQVLSELGFRVEDLSGDGVPELVVGMIDSPYYSAEQGKDIYAVYTIKDNQVEQVLTGWARNRYVYLGDGRFYYCGSGGAMYSSFGVYHLSADAMELQCEEFYFTDTIDDAMTEIGFFHNTSGVYDAAVSEKWEVTDEAFWNKEKELRAGKQDFELVPFEEIDNEEREILLKIEPEESIVTADYAKEGEEYLGSIVVNDTEYASPVIFCPSEDVTNFQINGLEFVDIDEAGKITFQTNVIFQQESLSAGQKILATMEFGETIPWYGISYVDASGTEYRYALTMSGEDGSVVLMEY